PMLSKRIFFAILTNDGSPREWPRQPRGWYPNNSRPREDVICRGLRSISTWVLMICSTGRDLRFLAVTNGRPIVLRPHSHIQPLVEHCWCLAWRNWGLAAHTRWLGSPKRFETMSPSSICLKRWTVLLYRR